MLLQTQRRRVYPLKNRSKAILWILTTFSLGAVFGALVEFMWIKSELRPGWDHRVQQMHRQQPPPERVLNHLSNLLDLDDAQESELNQVFEESRHHHRQVNRHSRDRYQTIRRQTQEHIRSILRPDQVEKFEEFLRRRQQRRENDSSRRQGRRNKQADR